mgnify:CR=1 FL=1
MLDPLKLPLLLYNDLLLLAQLFLDAAHVLVLQKIYDLGQRHMLLYIINSTTVVESRAKMKKEKQAAHSVNRLLACHGFSAFFTTCFR